MCRQHWGKARNGKIRQHWGKARNGKIRQHWGKARNGKIRQHWGKARKGKIRQHCSFGPFFTSDVFTIPGLPELSTHNAPECGQVLIAQANHAYRIGGMKCFALTKRTATELSTYKIKRIRTGLGTRWQLEPSGTQFPTSSQALKWILDQPGAVFTLQWEEEGKVALSLQSREGARLLIVERYLVKVGTRWSPYHLRMTEDGRTHKNVEDLAELAGELARIRKTEGYSIEAIAIEPEHFPESAEMPPGPSKRKKTHKGTKKNRKPQKAHFPEARTLKTSTPKKLPKTIRRTDRIQIPNS
jgi:hypothetical protein